MKTKINAKRPLQFETLENRELLSVTAAEFAQIRADNADLNLSANMSDYNVIEITADELSDANLRTAITQAESTTANDLIVLRTTETQNKIMLSGAPLGINIDAATKGSVTIVSIGNSALTIDANKQSQVFYIYNSEVGLAGLTITNGKAAGYGGGINIYSSNVTIARSTISNNSAEMAGGSQGGGLSARDSNVVLNQVDFIENLSTANTNGYGDGGGLYLDGATAMITNSTFRGNFAWGVWGAQGGGCYTWDTDATFTNCVFVGNDASDNGVGAADYLSTGGGMSQAGGTVTLTNVTITGNRATEYGAGYYVDGRNGATAATTYIRNSIVALNTGVSEQYHTSQGGKTYSNNVLNTDPKFVQNPGSIGSRNYGDLQLQSSSPAVNKGNNTYVSGVSTDILGNARIASGTVDMGAYERASVPAVEPTPYTSPTGVSLAPKTGAETSTLNVSFKVSAEDKVDGKTSYSIKLYDSTEKAVKTVTVKSAAANTQNGTLTASIAGLKAGMSYKVTVQTLADSGTTGHKASGITTGVTAQTKGVLPKAALKAATSAEITGANITGFSSESAVAVKVTNWNVATGLNTTGTGGTAAKPISKVDTLTVNYGSSSAILTYSVNTWSSSNANVSFADGIIVIKNLAANTKYAVKAQFGSETATSAAATSFNASTTKAQFAAPSNVSVGLGSSRGSEANSLTVSWNAAATSYTVKAYANPADTKPAKSVTVKGGVLSAELTGLKADTNYYVTVTANADSSHVASLESAKSGAIKTWAALPAATLKKSDYGDDQLSFAVTNWNTGAAAKKIDPGKADVLTVTYQPKNGSTAMETLTKSGNTWAGSAKVNFENGVITLTSLTASTSYAVTVKFSGTAATAAAAAKITAATTATSWKKAGTPAISEAGSNQLSVSWNAVESKDGKAVALKYSVVVYVDGQAKAAKAVSFTAPAGTAKDGALTAAVSGLKPNTKYTAAVIAVAGKVGGVSYTASPASDKSVAAVTRAQLTKPVIGKDVIRDSGVLLRVPYTGGKAADLNLDDLKTGAVLHVTVKDGKAGRVYSNTFTGGGGTFVLGSPLESTLSGVSLVYADGLLSATGLTANTAYEVSVWFSGTLVSNNNEAVSAVVTIKVTTKK